MKVIITGSGGMLGRELIRQLMEKTNYEVYALTSQVEKLSMCIGRHPNITILHADAFIKNQIICDKSTVLINCAFPRSEDGPRMAQGLDYICATLYAASQMGVGAVINISSQSVYDGNRAEQATEEDSPILQSKYAVGKYATELLTQMLCPIVPYTNIRLASLISKDFDQRLTNKLVDIALSNKEISILKSEQRFGFLDVEDAARGILMLMNTPSERWEPIYNLGSDLSYSLEEIAQLIQRLLLDEWNYPITIKESPGDKKGSSALCSSRLKNLIGNYQKTTLEESLRRIIDSKFSRRSK